MGIKICQEQVIHIHIHNPSNMFLSTAPAIGGQAPRAENAQLRERELLPVGEIIIQW